MIIEISIRIVVLTVVGWLAAICFRRNAAARHAVWTAVLAGMLLMPLLYSAFPRVPVRALPQRAFVTTPIAAPVDLSPRNINFVDASAPSRRVIGWADIAMAIYLFGVSVLGIRLLLGLRRRNRLIDAARPVGLRIVGDVELLESPDLAVPVTAGWLRPKILFPVSWREWDRERFDAVLAHEFAHVRRGDTLVAMFAAINRVFLWFHPAAWFVERQLAAAAEEAADDVALLMVARRDSYAEALLQIASALSGRHQHAAWSGTPMAASKVGARIRRLLDDKYKLPQPASIPRRIAFVGVCGVALLVVSLVTIERRAAAQSQSIVWHGNMPDPTMSLELARTFEDQLRQFPKDMATRMRLMNYYHSKGESDALLRHIAWVITNAPGDFAAWQIVPWSTHPQVRSAAAEMWIGAADRHRDDPRVLENAARFFEATGVVVRAEDYAKLARLLQPKDPKYTGMLINLYGRAIVALERSSSYFPRPSAHTEIFAERVKRDLFGMSDAELIGGVGRYIAAHMQQPLDNTTWRDPELASKLLARAAQLAPGDPRWRPDVVSSPAGTRLINSTPLKPLQMVPPVYPPLARQARIQGLVMFEVLIADDGSVENVKLMSGHPLLVPAATEAVKQWKFPPAKARTIAQVPFELAGAARSGPAPPSMNLLQLLLPSGGPRLIAGESKEVTIQLNFDVDSTGAPRNVRIAHPPEITPFASEIAKNAEKLRFTPATAAPYPAWIKMTWRHDGGVSIESNHTALP